MAKSEGLLKERYYSTGFTKVFFNVCVLKTQDSSHASQGNSQGSACTESNFFSSGPAFAMVPVMVWGISSICDLSFLTPCLQASVYTS